METSESYQHATPIRIEDPTLPLFDDFFSYKPTPPQLTVPQTQRSTWSNPSPPPVNPSTQSELKTELQERPHKLAVAPNTHNP